MIPCWIDGPPSLAAFFSFLCRLTAADRTNTASRFSHLNHAPKQDAFPRVGAADCPGAQWLPNQIGGILARSGTCGNAEGRIAMAFEIVEISENLVVVSLTSQLTYQEWEAGQQLLLQALEGRNDLRVLARTQGFEGWERTERWGDLGFFQANDEKVRRIALVGDTRWREDLLGFSLAGMRKAAVRFFETEEEAMSWLNSAPKA